MLTAKASCTSQADGGRPCFLTNADNSTWMNTLMHARRKNSIYITTVETDAAFKI